MSAERVTWFAVIGWPWGYGVRALVVERETPGFLFVVEKRTKWGQKEKIEVVRRVRKARHYPTFAEAKKVALEQAARRVKSAEEHLKSARADLKALRTSKAPSEVES